MRTSRRSIPSTRSTARRWMASTRRALSPVSARALRTMSTSLLLAVTLLAGANSPLVYGIGVAHAAAQAPQSKRDQGTSNQQVRNDPIPPSVSKNRPPNPNTKGPGGAIFLGPPQSMRAATVRLDPRKPLDFTGSDGRFELLVPVGAITAADVAAAGGQIQLRLEQTRGASGGPRSGHVILGSYRITVLGASGQPLALFAFHQPLTLRYHYTPADLSVMQPESAVVQLVDGSALPRPASGAAATTQTAWASTDSYTATTHRATNDSATRTLSYTLGGTGTGSSASASPLNAGGGEGGPVTTGSGALLPTFGSNAPVASWGTVQAFQTNLNAGALSYSFPLDLPSGPGGLVPALQVAYSSGSVNETENLQASASWVGEGWSLALGSISWAQYDGNACCGSPVYQNEWQITTPDGVSGQLIPPNGAVTTSNGTAFTATPLQWYTAPESHTKIIEITQNSYPCFRLWRPDGTMEEYGCTTDSRQYYLDSSSVQHTYRWDLDLIADPHGNQVVITYDQIKRIKSGTSSQQVIDATIQDVYYDFPTCPHSTPITRCAPATYPALVDVHFDTSNKPARFQGTTSSACSTWTNTPGNDRCDNPTAPSGGLAAPDVHTVHILNAVKVKVRPTTAATLSLLRAYYFWYEQHEGTTFTDPATGSQEGTAGYLDLTQVQQFGTNAADGSPPTGTSYPPLAFSYTSSQQERYEDVQYWSSSTCAPWYNYKKGGNAGLDLVQQEGAQLVHYWRDSSPTYVWHKGVTFGDTMQSAPSVAVNTTTQYNGSLEVIVRRSSLLWHYWKDTQGNWHADSGAIPGTAIDTSAPSLAFNSGAYNGNLEVVVREGTHLTHYYRDTSLVWHSPQTFADTISGDAALTFNRSNSNLEVVAQRNGQLAHYWLDSTNVWHGPETFGDTGVTYAGVALDYNGNTALPGFLEVVATENNQMVYYYRDTNNVWHKQSTYGSNIATGVGAKVNLDNGNLEVVAQSGGQLQHYWISTGPTWNAPDTVFGDGNLSASAPGLSFNSLVRCYYSQHANQTTMPALWAQTQNQRYPVTFDNGRGLHETFSWAEAHMNVWGGYNGLADPSPLSCTGLETTEPCYRADDQNWSRVILLRSDSTTNNAAGTAIDMSSRYTYTLTPVASGSYWFPVQGIQGGQYVWSWGNVNNGDFADYYNPDYRGFQKATADEWESHDGGVTGTWLASTDHLYATTSGWGVWDNAWVSDTTGGPGCYNTWNPGPTNFCPTSPSWSAANALPGRETETDTYTITGGTSRTLLRRVLSSYNTVSSGGWTSLDTCRPTGDPATPNNTGYTNPFWQNRENSQYMLVSQLNAKGNPVAVCDPRLLSQDTFFVDGATATLPTSCTTTTANIPCSHVAYQYDANQSYSGSHDYGNRTSGTTTGNDLGSGANATIAQTMDYATNDAITTSASAASGTYIVNATKQQATRDTGTSGTVHAIAQRYYDGTTTLGTLGSYGDVTLAWDAYQTDSQGPGGYDWTQRRYAYDGTTDNLLGIQQPNGQTGGCTLSAQGYSTCGAYDAAGAATYNAHLTQLTNALGQSTSSLYTTSGGGYDATDGYGEWLTGTKDLNNQTTSYAYDALGRLVSVTKPLNAAPTTQQYAYVNTCPATGAATGCIELDTTQQLTSSASALSRSFSDGAGQTVETLAPAPGENGTLVTYTLYDALGRTLFTSEPYTVAATSTYRTPDLTKPGTQYAYDGLGRVTSMQLVPAYNGTPTATTTTSYAPACSVQTGDSACYQGTTVVDPNGHQAVTYTDAQGRTVYTRAYSGNTAGTYATYATSAYQYDVLGNVTQITHPDGTNTTTFVYDLLSRQPSQSDPDLGTTTTAYDLDGNVTKTVDARGTAGTTYTGYDALDRPLWRNTTNTPTGAYVTYTYDGTASPPGTSTTNYGVGHLTGQTFASGPSHSLSGSFATYYDARGRTYETDQTIASTTYVTKQSFIDNDRPATITYPDGEQLTVDYYTDVGTASSGASRDLQSSISGFLVASVSYATTGGLATLGYGGSPATPTFTEALTYDAHQHLSEDKATLTGRSTPFYDLLLGYDPTYNVTSATTSLPAVGSHPAGTEQQSFCYDEQNRLIWAGTSGTPSGSTYGTCGPTPQTSTLDSGGYTAAYAYDTLGRLSTGPAGSYIYGDSAHLHAVTSTSAGYTASYDAAGDMGCRAPTASTTCSGTPTGAQFTYDTEGQLVQWQNTPSAPTTTDAFAYDGSGARVAQQVTSGGTTTSTVYVGALADYTSVAGTTTHVNHYTFSGRLVAQRDTALHYTLADQLGSPVLQVSASGTAESAVLRSPYGTSRYGASSLFTFGFTGQRQDDTTGLDYYNARYYDASAGQFTSADTVAAGGLNRYAYVDGNPETRNDPSGHCWPICAIVAAAVTFVAVTTISVVVQASQNGWNFSKVDYGSAAKTGAVAGLVVGATLLAGPLAEAATGAIAGAVSSGAAALGASAAAGEVAGSLVAGGIMGAGEGAVQGFVAGDRGGDLLADAGIGAVSGGLGGAAGSLAGKLARFGRVADLPEVDAQAARWTGAAAGAVSNATSQGFQIARGRQDGCDITCVASFGVSTGAGYGWGYAVSDDRPSLRWAGRHPFWSAAGAAVADGVGQSALQGTESMLQGVGNGNFGYGGRHIS